MYSPRPGSFRFSTALPFVVFLLSCIPPHAKYPLSDPAKAKADSRLAGTWIGTLEGNQDRVLLYVAPLIGARLGILMVSKDKTSVDTVSFEGFPTPLDGKTYFNLRERSPGSLTREEKARLEDAWFFVRYEVAADGTLRLWLMDDDLVKKALAAGRLQGTVADGNIEISSDAKALSAFIAKGPPDLFRPYATFRRAKSVEELNL